MMIAGTDNYLNVPVEATAIVGAAFALVALMLVFLLYINKKWCFNTIGFSCCDEPLPIKTTASKSLARGFSHDDRHSSSDSEEEVLRRLRGQNTSSQQQCNLQTTHITPYVTTYGGHTGHTGTTMGTGTYEANAGYSDSHVMGHALVSSHQHGGPVSRSHSQHSAMTSHVTVRDSLHQRTPSEDASHMISMAERGKVGASSNSSCSSTNSSAEASMESSANNHRHHRQLQRQQKINQYSTSSENQRLVQSPSSSGSEKLRETKIDNRGNVGTNVATKYQKLSAQESQDSSDINSNQDCIVVLSQEPLFDPDTLNDIKSCADHTTHDVDGDGDNMSELINRFGIVEIALLYDAPMRKMTVHVLQARGIPSRDRGQPTHTQVRLLMLPSKKQKHKSKIRSGENPQFMESFLLHRVNPEEVNSMGLRVRLYGCERMRRERLIGEAVVSFATIDLELENNLWLSLEPRANTTLSGSNGDLLSLARSDSTGSTTSMQHGGVPELLVGLAYNGTTGRLSVEIIKGSHFRNLALNKAPDTYVKLCLVSSMGQEMARSKTSTRRGQPNPLFKETFMFQVALFQLNEVTLMLSVYSKRNMKRNEMVGWFSMGLNSSGPEEMAHWSDMRETRGEQLSRWHVLVDS